MNVDGLIRALSSCFNQIIIPVSSWAQWAGILSNATEIHVNMPPHHPIMADMPQYIYHSEKSKQFFGRYSTTQKEVIFEDRLPPTQIPSAFLPVVNIAPSSLEITLLPVAPVLALTDTPLIALNVSITPYNTSISQQMPPELEEKDAIFEKLRIQGTTAGMWWWQEMRGA